uniref:Putative lipocalin ai-6 n=1 Tax=Rhodnius neglectus TaxID=72488 RepID=A0A0N7Z8D0_9HEMI
MKRIIVLTFFGILGCTFCAHVRTGPEGCQDVYNQAASNLNNEQFYKGSWYVTYGKYQNHTSLCTKFDMTWTPLQITYDVNTVKITCKGEALQSGARHTEYKCKAPECFNFNTTS